MMKYFSMFSGIGGFELGIKQSGVDMECVGYSEIDKYARSIYERRFPNHVNWGDATEINPKELPDFDLLVGGFPCQAFSLAGKRKGFDDTRGTLFFEIARILEEKKPSYLLLENVKGLLSHDHGNTFKTMLGILADLGYDVEWEVLNSKYLVPQNRERIFIKGYFRERCGGEIFSQTRDCGKIIAQMNTMPQTTEHRDMGWDYVGVRTGKLVDTDGVKGALSATGQNSGSRTFVREIGKGKLKPLNDKPQAQTVYDSDGLGCTLSANGGGQGGKTGLYKVDVVEQVVKRKHSVDIGEFQELLRSAKEDSGLTINEISESLGLPKTNVEHWFRTDEYFTIPLPEYWFKFKELLNINSTDYDAFVTEFEIADGEYDMSNRAYLSEGVSPTLSTGGKVKIIENAGKTEIKKIGNVHPSERGMNGNVYDSEGISPTLTVNKGQGLKIVEKDSDNQIKKCYGSLQKHRAETDGSYSPTLTSAMGEGGGHIPMIEKEEPEFVRMHGSNQEHRMISDELCCALNNHRTPMVEYDKPVEPKKIKKVGSVYNNQIGGVYDPEGISPTFCAGHSDSAVKIKLNCNTKKGYDEAGVGDGVRLDHPNRSTGRGVVQKEKTGSISTSCDWGTVNKDFRIRRLTPLECERLQGFPDNWTKYGKDGELISDTQRYKCCGNAVTVDIIEYVIRSMFGK